MVVVAEPFEALVVVVVDVIAVVIVVEESSEFSIGQNFRRLLDGSVFSSVWPFWWFFADWSESLIWTLNRME